MTTYIKETNYFIVVVNIFPSMSFFTLFMAYFAAEIFLLLVTFVPHEYKNEQV